MEIPNFSTKEQLFKHLVDNKKELMSLKKASTKNADSIYANPTIYVEHTDIANKQSNINSSDELKLRLVINTTGIMDSHSDVHIKGLCKILLTSVT